MDLGLVGRTALITGASSGIGTGVARVLAKEGTRIAIVGRRTDALQRLSDEIAAAGGGTATLIAADVTAPDDIGRIASEAVAALGAIDILINCAGGSRPISFEASDQAWEEAFALNFTAARQLTEALLPAMIARRWGRIISLSGSMEPRGLNAAGPAKAALHHWAKGLSCDVAADGVTINTIAPGRINSEQTLEKLHPTEEARQNFIRHNIPIGYFGDPEDIGHLIGFLASPLARYITGAVIPVDGGMHYFAH